MPQHRWKQPELSVGSQISSLDIWGRYKCWHVKANSPAHIVWKRVSKLIDLLLNDQVEHLDAKDSDLMIEMFMIGRKPISSVPTVLFSCESKPCRQKAIALVHKKSILAEYPGVHMAESSRIPKALAQEEDTNPIFLPEGVYMNGPLRTCGTSVLISFGHKNFPRKATIGGIVSINETLYGVTAGHAFTPAESQFNNEFSFFGTDDPLDNSDHDDETLEITSQGRMPKIHNHCELTVVS